MKEKINMKKIARICTFIIGLLFLLYFLFMGYKSCLNLGLLMKNGEIKLFDDFVQILQYMMASTGDSLFYGISCLFYSYMINKDMKSTQ